MKTLTVPAQYREYLESIIALAVRDIECDIQKRAAGEAPLIRETLRDANAPGQLVVVVSELPSEEEQRRDREWPRAAERLAPKRRTA